MDRCISIPRENYACRSRAEPRAYVNLVFGFGVFYPDMAIIIIVMSRIELQTVDY